MSFCIYLYTCVISSVTFAYEFHCVIDHTQHLILSSLIDCLATSNMVASHTLFLQHTHNLTNLREVYFIFTL